MRARQQKLIVDGYNVVYTDDRMRRQACRDLEGARQSLLGQLAEYLKRKRLQITVVFDGRGSMVDGDVIVPGKLQVVYSRQGESADQVILRMLRESASARAHIVVTSDMSDIGGEAKRMGCEVIGSKRFLERIQAASNTPSQTAAGENDEEDMSDVDYWLRRFEDEGEDAQS